MITYYTNENESVSLQLQFVDELGNPSIPQIVSWKVEDVMSGTILQEWEDLNVTGTTYLLTIPASFCSIIDSSHPVELKRVTIKTTFSPLVTVIDEVDIYVKNLGGVP